MERSIRLPAHLNQTIVVNAEHSDYTIRKQDRFMRITNIIRIMCMIHPPHVKISDDSKVTIQECVFEFISFITGEANDHCQREQRQTITTEDVLWAMNNLGFDDYIEPLTLYLHRYHKNDGGARGSSKGEPLLLKHPMVDPASGCSITPHHPSLNFPMDHHHGFFVYPPPMKNSDMQGGSIKWKHFSICSVCCG